MRFIEFSPFWNVPPSIAQTETVPKLKREPTCSTGRVLVVAGDGRVLKNLSNDNLDALQRVELRIDMAIGPKNALGDMGLLFPTTTTSTCTTRQRRGCLPAAADFSHGCIRVEAPVALAKFVLDTQPEWDEARIREAMAKGHQPPCVCANRCRW